MFQIISGIVSHFYLKQIRNEAYEKTNYFLVTALDSPVKVESSFTFKQPQATITYP